MLYYITNVFSKFNEIYIDNNNFILKSYHNIKEIHKR